MEVDVEVVDVDVAVAVEVDVVVEVVGTGSGSFDSTQRLEFLTQDPSEHWVQFRGLASAAAPGKRNAPAPMRSRLRRVVSMTPPLHDGESLSLGKLTWDSN